MSSNSYNVKIERDCTRHCKSGNHVSKILSSITKKSVSDKQVASYIFRLCYNFSKAQDEFGRTAVHLGASCGRVDLCLWLLTIGGADVNRRDFESGYTPLHRAIYYGYINLAVKLIAMGANVNIADNEDQTVFDLISIDLTTPSLEWPCQVYVWGINNNYTLGIGSNDTKKQPELLDQFKTNNISIVQVEMSEMHCLFRSKCGKVWSCGIGQGGRLGTGSQKPSITPQLVKTFNEPCTLISSALNHSLLLLASGTVLSFGLNAHHQLGLSNYVEMSLNPKQVNSVNFNPDNPIKGICASKYHSVFYNDESIFVCGLNAGQLGLACFHKSPFISAPRPVPLNLGKRKITHVASSTGAIAVSVENGDVYLLHQYQFRKIASKLFGIVKIELVGGELDNKLVTEPGNGQLKVVILNSKGELLIWQNSNQQINRCLFGMRHICHVKDISLSQDHVYLVTNTGEAYHGHLSSKEKFNSASDLKNPFHKFLDRAECFHIKLTRFPHIFRAVSIKSDPKGNNFTVVQVHPKAELTEIPVMSKSEFGQQLADLLEEASLEDELHDVTFKIGSQYFPAHRFILSVNGNLLYNLSCKEDLIEINDIKPFIFKQLLTFLYTGHCLLLQSGQFDHLTSLFSNKEDPIRLLMDACARYKIQSLSKLLSNMRYSNGVLSTKEPFEVDFNPPKFSRSDAPELYDVTLKSNSGETIEAHKCVLSARLDYFKCMLLGGWKEGTKYGDKGALKLPFSTKVLKDVIDFLYDEKVPASVTPDDLEHTIQLLILSDQWLLDNLREACEIALTNCLTLRNALSVLQLSFIYNTPQLKKATMQFISINIGVFIELRLLENLNDSILSELTDYYRNFSGKAYRVVTPFYNAPSDGEFDDNTDDETNLIPWPDKFEMDEISLLLSSSPSSAEKQNWKPKRQHQRTPRKSSSSLNESSSDPIKIEHIEIADDNDDDVDFVSPSNQSSSPLVISQLSSSQNKENQEIWSSSDFPSLDQCDKAPSVKSFDQKIGLSKVFPPKSFQKQKKQVIPSSSSSPPPQSKPKTWAQLPPPPPPSSDENDHFRHLFKEKGDNSSNNETNFNSIIAHDIEKRSNWTKMKSKSFHLTQLEDKAIVDLMVFYNAQNEFDERITVERLLPKNIDQPTWTKAKKNLFV